MRRALGLITLLVLAGPAAADTKKGPHKEGDYGGVIPGQKPEGPKSKRPPAAGTLSWIGFEATNGGAKLFFQSPGQFDVSQRMEGTTLVVTLGLSRLGANTWRQVDTRYFDNPLSGVTAKAARGKGKKGIEVRIKFKNPKDAREGAFSTKSEADGMFYAYLAFPEGTPEPGNAAKGDDVDKN